ncbi:hypothetical protein MWU58_10775 [Flavobacteriaceae bacterium S0825]|uniref:hypothetical protein n=1 Tax=Gaetbulibacter sp. S0825 TaxID=2720084 RepID=UPI00142F7449|nr:hypothetical protein [Gaetbulibacter sp. S0825]MCK0109781.1 hypothetical protein [Flavobacteriaceae bacterium S0825]NIX65413.1 hypothetical protein [Gaetbulibacter sp. S0825]
MKKLIKITSGVALMFMLVFTLSSFSSNTEVEVDNNGTIVEVVKGQVWTLTACGGFQVMSDKSTRQYKNGSTHLLTIVFELPEGHCLIQKKAYKTVISGITVNITPSGMAIAKYINNN